MAGLEVIVQAKVRPGQLEGLTAQAAEILRLTRAHDTHTWRCDWFINEDGTELEVHESFPDEQGLVEHKMHTAEATSQLFHSYASDHRSTLYGEVSDSFVAFVQDRMGATPAVFSFLQGLDQAGPGLVAAGRGDPPGHWGGVTGHLEVHANLQIRPGQLEGFKHQVAEIMRLTRAKDTQTVRYDWFIDEDRTECEVHEAYLSEAGLFEHNTHVMDARATLFEKFAYGHRMTAFGPVSQELMELADRHAGGMAVYSFLLGLEAASAV